MSKPTQDRIRRVLLESLPADPKWVVWVEGVVEELAGSPVEDPRLTQIRALRDHWRNLLTEPLSDEADPRVVLLRCTERLEEVLDAVSVDATPAQEEERSRDEYGARPLLGVGVGDDTWPIERATPAQRLDRDALVMLIDGWGAEQPLHLADAVLALVRPVEGIVLSPEEADVALTLANGYLGRPVDRRYGFSDRVAALAARLEASS